MKAFWILFTTLAVPGIAAADCAVEVHVANLAVAEPAALFQAKATANAIFARIGIHLEWKGRAASTCWPPIEIRLEARNPPADRPDSMAYAQPYLADGTAIHVFVGRVAAMVPRGQAGTLLGHVLAHEIAHMLEGINRHSDRGIMKAHWDTNDFRAMESHSLPFAATDVLLIQAAGKQPPGAATATTLVGAND